MFTVNLAWLVDFICFTLYICKKLILVLEFSRIYRPRLFMLNEVYGDKGERSNDKLGENGLVRNMSISLSVVFMILSEEKVHFWGF